ncbi:MAG: hypothetical protein BA867_10590 [Desulfobacterales bacterium S5133MH16]|nr:MAG: hypothetical protein BA867_10590 [Desulfobacterales bacterium S5133MH16]
MYLLYKIHELEKALQIVTVKAWSFLTPRSQKILIISIRYGSIDRVGTEDAVLHQQKGKKLLTHLSEEETNHV